MIKPKHDVHILYAYVIENVNIVTKCKLTFATSVKLSALKGPCKSQTITKSHFVTIAECGKSKTESKPADLTVE